MNQIEIAKFMEKNYDKLLPNPKYTEEEIEEALSSVSSTYTDTLDRERLFNPSLVQTMSIIPPTGLIGINHFCMGEIVKGIFKYLCLVAIVFFAVPLGSLSEFNINDYATIQMATTILGILIGVTVAASVIWWIVDMLTVKKLCRTKNCKKLMAKIDELKSNTSNHNANIGSILDSDEVDFAAIDQQFTQDGAVNYAPVDAASQTKRNQEEDNVNYVSLNNVNSVPNTVNYESEEAVQVAQTKEENKEQKVAKAKKVIPLVTGIVKALSNLGKTLDV